MRMRGMHNTRIEVIVGVKKRWMYGKSTADHRKVTRFGNKQLVGRLRSIEGNISEHWEFSKEGKPRIFTRGM